MYLGLQADCGRMTAPARGHAPQEGLRARPAGPGAAMHARPWIAAASGLRLSSQHVSSGPGPRAAGIGCARASRRRGLAFDCSVKPEDDRHG